jgi:hypothetical protein
LFTIYTHSIYFICRYKQRVAAALRANSSGAPKILSMIIDGMDQNHTRIPHLGTQNALSETINQGIIGVKEHGSKVKFYRSLDTAPKGADLTIYCILRQIESWRDRHGYFPEEIYLQLDGGSENANQYVLAMLELLVAKNITKVIHYTRLPTGHTHEDIDSCFGVLWRVLRGKCCETLSKYKEMVENTFKADGLKAEVEDVLIVPNYIQLFEGCIDEKFGRAHKLLQTQHQWRFEAVPCSQYFPLGVKATYRSYSSDRVVEFVEKPKMECMSNIGQLIGLEPIITYVRWYPTENCNPDRPLEGIFSCTECHLGDPPIFPFLQMMISIVFFHLENIKFQFQTK